MAPIPDGIPRVGSLGGQRDRVGGGSGDGSGNGRENGSSDGRRDGRGDEQRWDWE